MPFSKLFLLALLIAPSFCQADERLHMTLGLVNCRYIHSENDSLEKNPVLIFRKSGGKRLGNGYCLARLSCESLKKNNTRVPLEATCDAIASDVCPKADDCVYKARTIRVLQ